MKPNDVEENSNEDLKMNSKHISEERSCFTRKHQEPILSGTPKHNGAVPAETICTRCIQIERKAFEFQLQQNSRGRFLRIIEKVSGRRDAIVIPSTGLPQFKIVVEELLRCLNA